MTGLDQAERRGLSLPGRLVLVLLGQLGLAAEIWLGTRDTVHVGVLLYLLLPAMGLLGILVTVQAHHRLPVAWHVVVVLGWGASFLVAPWASTWADTAARAGFDGAYVTVLAWYALVAVESSCLLALVRPAGTSYITWNKIRQADGPGPSRPAR